MQTVINGILTEYQVLGKTNNKNILILHGWGQSSKEWQEVGIGLTKKYKVFLLDLPGFGGSSIPKIPFNTKGYANFVSEFARNVIRNSFILIGHSFGGKIAIKASSENISSITKLILISPSGIENKSFFTSTKIIVAKILKIFLFWLPKEIKENLIKEFGSRDYINAKETRNIFSKIVNDIVIEDAKRINIPTVIIWGEKDEEVNIKTSKKLKSLIKNSILRVVWGERHSVNIEAPGKLLSIIKDYV